MRNYPLVIIILFGFSFNTIAQGKQVNTYLRNVYRKMANTSDYIYIADTSLIAFPFLYEDLKYAVKDADTVLLANILKKGKIQLLSNEKLTKRLRAEGKKKTITEFASIETSMLYLSKNEVNTLNAIDSLDKLKLNFLRDNDTTKHILYDAQQKELFESKEFLSYQAKLQKVDKRLLFFFPFVRYNGSTLLVIGCYKSRTDTYLIVNIIH
jgi:hypothetical protein